MRRDAVRLDMNFGPLQLDLDKELKLLLPCPMQFPKGPSDPGTREEVQGGHFGPGSSTVSERRARV